MKKEDKKLLEAIVAGMQERKAKRVVTVDMTKLDAPCQYFVICEGDSNVHVSSIAMEVKDYVRKNASEKPFATDGFENCEYDLLVNAVVGFRGLKPTLTSLKKWA
jgi:ribosome-associated protein